jgi:hypothetical protein
MEEKTNELVSLQASMSEINSKQQHYKIKSKLFRKTEILDLISTIKRLSPDNPHKNELNIKQEKMQSELTVIEEDLFEMMKKNGSEVELIIKEQEEMEIDSDNLKPVDEESQASSQTEESEEEEIPRRSTNKLQEMTTNISEERNSEVKNEVLEHLEVPAYYSN